GSHYGQCSEADRHGDYHVVVEQPHEQHAAHERERQREHHDRALGNTAEVEVQEQEDDRERDRHDNPQLARGALQRLELSRPLQPITGWQSQLLLEQTLRIVDVTPDVAAEHVYVDDIVEISIFRLDESRTFHHRDARQLT